MLFESVWARTLAVLQRECTDCDHEQLRGKNVCRAPRSDSEPEALGTADYDTVSSASLLLFVLEKRTV